VLLNRVLERVSSDQRHSHANAVEIVPPPQGWRALWWRWTPSNQGEGSIRSSKALAHNLPTFVLKDDAARLKRIFKFLSSAWLFIVCMLFYLRIPLRATKPIVPRVRTACQHPKLQILYLTAASLTTCFALLLLFLLLPRIHSPPSDASSPSSPSCRHSMVRALSTARPIIDRRYQHRKPGLHPLISGHLPRSHRHTPARVFRAGE